MASNQRALALFRDLDEIDKTGVIAIASFLEPTSTDEDEVVARATQIFHEF